MILKSGKKEIWLGMSLDTYMGGKPELEIAWGLGGKNRVVVPFEMFVDSELEQSERGGPQRGDSDDEIVVHLFKKMRRTLKLAMKHARKRNNI